MTRQALGRGLNALIPSDIFGDTAGPNRGSLRMVPLDQIKPNPDQPRMVFAGRALDALASSIREHGIITPLLVQRGERGYVLIAGERRLRASGLAGLDEVPCFVRDDLGHADQLMLALVENIQREDLDPIEAAMAYRRLLDEFSLTQEQVARRVGKERATIANAIRLLKLPDFVLVELRAGRISAGHAKALLPLPTESLMRDVLCEVLTSQLSVRATERLVSQQVRSKPKKAKSRRVFPHAADMMTRALGTRVHIEAKARGERGRIVIDYYSHEDLKRLVDQLAP